MVVSLLSMPAGRRSFALLHCWSCSPRRTRTSQTAGRQATTQGIPQQYESKWALRTDYRPKNSETAQFRNVVRCETVGATCDGSRPHLGRIHASFGLAVRHERRGIPSVARPAMMRGLPEPTSLLLVFPRPAARRRTFMTALSRLLVTLSLDNDVLSLSNDILSFDHSCGCGKAQKTRLRAATFIHQWR